MTPIVTVAATADVAGFAVPGDRLTFTFARTGSLSEALTIYFRVEGTAQPLEDVFATSGPPGFTPFVEPLVPGEIHEVAIPAGKREVDVVFEPNRARGCRGDRFVELRLVAPPVRRLAREYVVGWRDSARGRLVDSALHPSLATSRSRRVPDATAEYRTLQSVAAPASCTSVSTTPQSNETHGMVFPIQQAPMEAPSLTARGWASEDRPADASGGGCHDTPFPDERPATNREERVYAAVEIALESWIETVESVDVLILPSAPAHDMQVHGS